MHGGTNPREHRHDIVCAAVTGPVTHHVQFVVCQRTDDGETSDRRRQRKHGAIVLEKDHRSRRELTGGNAEFGTHDRRLLARVVSIGPFEQTGMDLDPQYSPHGLVHDCDRQPPFPDQPRPSVTYDRLTISMSTPAVRACRAASAPSAATRCFISFND